MHLPFSHEAFLDLFGEYNRSLLPAVVALWVITAAMAVQWLRRHGSMNSSAVLALLAVHWAWSGIVYQWFFFRTINPAAGLFSAAFVVQALCFIGLAFSRRVGFTIGRSLRSILGCGLVIYGLIYPTLGFGFGLDYPRLPLFAVPCPTTLLTAGLLLMASGAPRFTNVVPILWAAIGSSAALLLEIRADLGLIPAGVLLAIDTAAPRVLGLRAS